MVMKSWWLRLRSALVGDFPHEGAANLSRLDRMDDREHLLALMELRATFLDDLGRHDEADRVRAARAVFEEEASDG